jgi:eukaryotic-like serine/threonine-protein kinase
MRIGRYEVLQHLATGGMGKVHLARSTGPAGFEHHVVLKMLDIEGVEDDPYVEMFLDEARVVGRMHHQHIAPAYALDRDSDGRYFLVMDYIHGQTAKAAWMRSRELGVPLPIAFAVTVATAGAAALHYAHTLTSRDGEALGVVHRDVSLANLMIGYDGAVKLIDFGIALAANRRAQTVTGQVKGTVAYMAPEQIDGRRIDSRADIFSLGIVLYELATMTRAFRAHRDRETAHRIRHGIYTRPSEIVPGFPAELERIIATALQVDPRQRFRDAGTMRRELEAFGRSQRLVVGDPAVVPVMEVLFEHRSEPWQTARGSAEFVPYLESIDDESEISAPAIIYDAPTAPLHGDPPTMPIAVRPTMQLAVPLEARIEVQAPPPSPVATVAPSPDREPESPTKPWLRWARWLVPFALLGCGAALADAYWARGSSAAPPIDLSVAVPRVPAAPPEPRATVPPPPPPIVTPIRDTVHVVITTTPSDATILLDGQRLGHAPFEGDVPATSGMHVLKIRRRGYLPLKFDIELANDVVRDITLQASPAQEQ